MKLKLADWIATCACVGRIPFAPGTWGSLTALPFVWLLKDSPTGFLTLLAVSIIIGIWAGNVVCRNQKNHDPSYVVIDEFCGILLTFFWIPVTGVTLLTGFILFRLFDILKPPPIRQLERFPLGWGVMADDLGAGVLANIMLQIIVRYASM